MKNLKYSIAVSCVSCRKEITTSGLTRHLKKGCYNINGSILPRKHRTAWNKGLNKSHPVVAKYTAKNTAILRAKVADGKFIANKLTKNI